MTPRQRKPWSKVIGEAGISVQLYECAPGGPLHRLVWVNGARDRKSLRHADRVLAEKQMREPARRLAELQFAGNTGPITFGQLSALYQRHRLPMLSADRQKTVPGQLALLEKHFARTMRRRSLAASRRRLRRRSALGRDRLTAPPNAGRRRR